MLTSLRQRKIALSQDFESLGKLQSWLSEIETGSDLVTLPQLT